MDRTDRHWYTSSQAAGVLGVTREGVRQMVLRGVLPSRTSPLGRLFSKTVVHRLAEQRGQKTRPAA